MSSASNTTQSYSAMAPQFVNIMYAGQAISDRQEIRAFPAANSEGLFVWPILGILAGESPDITIVKQFLDCRCGLSLRSRLLWSGPTQAGNRGGGPPAGCRV